MKNETKYHIGVDMAIEPNWWKRLLVWIGIRKKDWDYTSIVFVKEKDGILHITDHIRL